MILDQNISVILIFIEILIFFLNFYFVLGIILGHFRHPKSIYRYRNLTFLWKFDFFLTSKSIFQLNNSISRLKKNKKNVSILFDRKIDFLNGESMSVLKNREKPTKIAKAQIYRGFLGRRHQAGGLLQ